MVFSSMGCRSPTRDVGSIQLDPLDLQLYRRRSMITGYGIGDAQAENVTFF